MAVRKIKLAYVIGTPELRVHETVTAYQGDLEVAFGRLKDLGYDGAELMILNPDLVDPQNLEQLSKGYGIEIPALCTGEVYGQGRLSFMDPDPSVRKEALSRTKKIIDFAAPFGAQVNIGRLRGRFSPEVPVETSLGWMYAAFEEVADYANGKGVTMILEPVTNLACNNINTTLEGIEVVRKVGKQNFRLMADIFTMNLEDKSMEQSFREARPYLTHIHVCDSNRLAPGRGNLDFRQIIEMIKGIDYEGYFSAEIFQHPDKDLAIEETMNILGPLL